MTAVSPPVETVRKYRPPRWKRWLSHVFPLTLERPPSDYTPSLAVRLDRGRVMVDAQGVNYAFGGLDAFFREAFRKLGLPRPGTEAALVLGFGPGNVATILREREAPSSPMHIAGVERDPVMFELGRRYFGLDALQPLALACEDVVDYLARAPEAAFDLVVVDVFVEDVVPETLERSGVLRQMARILRPGGLLFFNRLVDTPEHRRQTQRFYQHMQRILPGTYGISVFTNWVCLYRQKNTPGRKSPR